VRSCEICGEERADLSLVIFEGRRVYACSSCIKKFSLVKVSSIGATKALRQPKAWAVRRPLKSIALEEDYELVEGFGEKVKRAREAMGLTQAELASKLKIKVSLLKKIEAEKISPPFDLVRKLEKALNTRLLEKASKEITKSVAEESIEWRPTLGDFFPEEGE